MRNALRYVLLNARRHGKARSGTVRIDPASSGRWFEGWKLAAQGMVVRARGRPGGTVRAITDPRTWLLRAGWREAGPLLDPAAAPG